MIRVIDPGLFTTVQDIGRFGYGEFGVPRSGAMDDFSYHLGSILVGNFENEAALEFTQKAGVYEFLSDTIIAIVGADFGFSIDGDPVENFKTYYVKKGSILKDIGAKTGYRSYLCISGGIDTPLILNSRSTFVRAGIGGYNGRALKKGDLLKVGKSRYKFKRSVRLQKTVTPDFSINRVRIIPSVRIKKIENFLNVKYNITMDIDRMGVRLKKSEKFDSLDRFDVVTEPTFPGTIQITNSGEPIILMNDCQTTGGYRILGYVIDVDLYKIAQLRPKDSISFEVIDFTEAYLLMRKRDEILNRLKIGMELNYVY
jgi:biotin-dependent carboxylase-like uncharacterized protein